MDAGASGFSRGRGRGGDRGGFRGGDRGGFRGRGRGRGDGDFGGDRGGRGRGRGDRGGRGGRGRGRGRGRGKEDEWNPVTKLGRLVKEGKFPDINDIFSWSIKIKEAQIIDYYFPADSGILKDDVMDVKPVQKQTAAGQRTRFKAWVAVGDYKNYCGVGQKCAAEVGIAIRGAFTLAKLSLVPIRKGYWGSMTGEPHTVPCKVTGKCGSCRVRLIPAPRGTGLVASQQTKKVLAMAGLQDVYCRVSGETRTTGNFVIACFLALRKTYKIMTPDLWIPRPLVINPLDRYPTKVEKRIK